MFPFLADTGLDVPWIIVAMIFISFLRFLFDRLKGNPKEGLEDFDDLEELDEFDEVETQRNAERSPNRSSPSTFPPPLPSSSPKPTSDLRRFLETLAEAAGAEVTPPPPPVPEPLPQPVEASSEQKKAAEAFRKRKTWAVAKKRETSSIVKTLANPASLRTAIVLREVLGPPVALRDEREF